MNNGVVCTPSLTGRQKQILQLIAKDLTAKEIGEKLGISHKTVELHKQNLRNKLGAPGTVGLILVAIRNGLIEP
jgi:DNA-binding CsgD family transcriptional regulator